VVPSGGNFGQFVQPYRDSIILVRWKGVIDL
jgi:hypothetical protein